MHREPDGQLRTIAPADRKLPPTGFRTDGEEGKRKEIVADARRPRAPGLGEAVPILRSETTAQAQQEVGSPYSPAKCRQVGTQSSEGTSVAAESTQHISVNLNAEHAG